MKIIKLIQKICLNTTPLQVKIDTLNEVKDSVNVRLYMYLFLYLVIKMLNKLKLQETIYLIYGVNY